MRPTCSNSMEVSLNHWRQETIPLQGFLIFYNKDDVLYKYNVYVTAPSTSTANWAYTSLSFLEVMRFMYPRMGPIRHLHAVVDGCAAQVFIFIFGNIYTFQHISFKYILTNF